MALSGRLGRIVAAGPVGGVADGVTVPDAEYADLTLAMRTGEDPGAVFDAFVARGQIRLHADPGGCRGRWPRSPPRTSTRVSAWQ